MLYEKNADEQRPVASITKVMTLLADLRGCGGGEDLLGRMWCRSANMPSSMGGSQIWLEAGEQMTLDDLLKAICVSSANDAAVAVAEYVGRERACLRGR